MSDELRERVADLVRYNSDPLAIADEAIALVRGEQADRIEQLEAALRAILAVPADWGNESYEMEEIARAALEERT